MRDRRRILGGAQLWKMMFFARARLTIDGEEEWEVLRSLVDGSTVSQHSIYVRTRFGRVCTNPNCEKVHRWTLRERLALRGAKIRQSGSRVQ